MCEIRDQETKDTWEEYLQEHKEHMAPVFASYGVSFEMGLMLITMNVLNNNVRELLEKSDDGGWNA